MTSIVDLERAALKETTTQCDVCIVGAGAAGLYLAGRLARSGRSVVLLEAGGSVCEPGASVGIEAVFAGAPYRGAVEGARIWLGRFDIAMGWFVGAPLELDRAAASEPHAIAWTHIVTRSANGPKDLSNLGLSGAPTFLTFPTAC